MVHSRKFFCDLWDEKDSETDSNVYFPKNDAGFGDDDDSIAESDDDADAVVLTTLMTIKHLWTGVAYERQVSVLTKGVAHAQRLGDHLATEGGYTNLPTYLHTCLPTYLYVYGNYIAHFQDIYSEVLPNQAWQISPRVYSSL